MSAAAQNQVVPASNFAGALIDILDRVEYRRVRPDEVADPVYKLRYEAYRREDFIPFNSLSTLRDEFDDYNAFPNSWNFGIYIDGRLVASLRIHHLTPDNPKSPANTLFADVLKPLLDQGATFIDPTRFTVDLEASLAYPALPFLTLRLAVMATKHFNATYGLHCVRSEHGPFYKRVLSSSLMCPAREYPGVGFPMELWGTRAQEVYEKTLRRYPFFDSTDEERRHLFAPPFATPIWVHPSVRKALTEA
jgi:N-acyl amino acid synthase FeeM